MSTSIYFTLLVVHTYYYSQHINRREGGGEVILSVNLFTCFHFPTLLVSCTHFVFLGSVEYIVSCHCFGIETVGKEKIYIIIFHFMGEKENSVLELYQFLSIYLSYLYVSMSVSLSMPVCLVLFVFV